MKDKDIYQAKYTLRCLPMGRLLKVWVASSQLLACKGQLIKTKTCSSPKTPRRKHPGGTDFFNIGALGGGGHPLNKNFPSLHVAFLAIFNCIATMVTAVADLLLDVLLGVIGGAPYLRPPSISLCRITRTT